MSESGLNGSGQYKEPKPQRPPTDAEDTEETSLRGHLLAVHRDAVSALAGVREAKEALGSAVIEMHGVVEYARQELRAAVIMIERLVQKKQPRPTMRRKVVKRKRRSKS